MEGVLRGVDAARMTDDFFELLAGFTYSAGSGATGNVSSRLESFISRKLILRGGVVDIYSINRPCLVVLRIYHFWLVDFWLLK